MPSRSPALTAMAPADGWPMVEDLSVFIAVVRTGSFARAARELGLSPSGVSKRIALLESKLDTRLFYRISRAVTLTPEGEQALPGAIALVEAMDDYLSQMRLARESLTGTITLSCSFGFGDDYLAAALAGFSERYPEVAVKLTLRDRQVNLVEEGIDVEILVGEDLNELYIARELACNRRILCAHPDYLARAGIPETPAELEQHQCLIIQERNDTFGHWQLTNGQLQQTCRVRGALSSNSGHTVMNWVRQGRGIALRSEWDAARDILHGELVHVLPGWYQTANIRALYARRPSGARRIQALVDFLSDYFRQHPPARLPVPQA